MESGDLSCTPVLHRDGLPSLAAQPQLGFPRRCACSCVDSLLISCSGRAAYPAPTERISQASLSWQPLRFPMLRLRKYRCSTNLKVVGLTSAGIAFDGYASHQGTDCSTVPLKLNAGPWFKFSPWRGRYALANGGRQGLIAQVFSGLYAARTTKYRAKLQRMHHVDRMSSLACRSPRSAKLDRIHPRTLRRVEKVVRYGGFWSGRRGSNPQPTAWEAATLPLSYSRPLTTCLF